jgi:hypothetical protein
MPQPVAKVKIVTVCYVYAHLYVCHRTPCKGPFPRSQLTTLYLHISRCWLLNGPNGFGGLGVSVLASGTQVRGFKPSRSRRIFKGGKNPHHAFLRKGSKAVRPMSQICFM